jgi:hypothetical protein
MARSGRHRAHAVLCGAVLALSSVVGAAQSRAVDRAAVMFTAAELGGSAYPRFIWQRELSFLARIEALSDGGFQPTSAEPYLDRHVRSALERAVAETMLESFDIDPTPTAEELKRRAVGARLVVVERVGGAAALTDAAAQEGIADIELWRIFQRQARASLYLDRMVTPMLEPSLAELRSLHQGTVTPFSNQPFEQVQTGLRRWYIGQRLAGVLGAFYETARGRIHLQLLGESKGSSGSQRNAPNSTP